MDSIKIGSSLILHPLGVAFISVLIGFGAGAFVFRADDGQKAISDYEAFKTSRSSLEKQAHMMLALRSIDDQIIIWPNEEANAVYQNLSAGFKALKAEADTTELSIEGKVNVAGRLSRLKGQMEMIEELVSKK